MGGMRGCRPMAIHHLNCGTLCPYGGKLITGEGGFSRGRACAVTAC